MGWFSRLKDKFRKLQGRPQEDDDVVYEGTLPKKPTFHVEPPILDRFPAEELTAEGRAYLVRYPDVAAHKEAPHVYGERPRAHYLDHGKAEGRIWDLPEVADEPAQEWPKLIKHQGVNIMAVAPLNPAWQPSMQAWVMGHMDKTSVGDPSNAPEGYPPRSESGWPLIYPGVHWDGLKWAGEPTGPARFHCGESSYGTEDQALAEARRIAASKGAPVDPGWAKAHENMKKPRKPKAPVEPPEEPL